MATVTTPLPEFSAPNALFYQRWNKPSPVSNPRTSFAYARVGTADLMRDAGFPDRMISWFLYRSYFYSRDYIRFMRETIASERRTERKAAKIRRYQREYLRSIDWEAAA